MREDADVVEMRHFTAALETFRINYEQRQRQLQHYLRLSEEFCNDAEFLEQLRQSYGRTSRLEAALEEMG